MNRLPRGSRGIAWIGVAVGVFAAFVALPPIEVRSPVAPVVIGLFALTIGVGSWLRGERKVGGYAVAAGVLGFTIGYLATRSSVGHLETVVVWGALLAAMLRYATPLAFASIGGLFSERSGVVNIGLEGMMLTGAFFAVWGSDVTGAWPLGLAIGVLAGALMALLHAFFSISLRSDQIVGGTAINFLALGLTSYLYFKLYGAEGTPTDLSTIPDVRIGFLERHPRCRQLPRRRLRPAQPDDLARDPARLRDLGDRLQDADRLAHPIGRRAPTRRGHSRDQRLCGPLRLGDGVRHARSSRRCISFARIRELVQRQHDSRARVSSPSRP